MGKISDEVVKDAPICRTCLCIITGTSYRLNENSGLGNGLKYTHLLRNMVPELYLGLSSGPEICAPCRDSLKNSYTFRNKCLETETLIGNYLKNMRCTAQTIELSSVIRHIRMHKMKQTAENILSEWNEDSNEEVPKRLPTVPVLKKIALVQPVQPAVTKLDNIKPLPLYRQPVQQPPLQFQVLTECNESGVYTDNMGKIFDLRNLPHPGGQRAQSVLKPVEARVEVRLGVPLLVNSQTGQVIEQINEDNFVRPSNFQTENAGLEDTEKSDEPTIVKEVEIVKIKKEKSDSDTESGNTQQTKVTEADNKPKSPRVQKDKPQQKASKIVSTEENSLNICEETGLLKDQNGHYFDLYGNALEKEEVEAEKKKAAERGENLFKITNICSVTEDEFQKNEKEKNKELKKQDFEDKIDEVRIVLKERTEPYLKPVNILNLLADENLRIPQQLNTRPWSPVRNRCTQPSPAAVCTQKINSNFAALTVKESTNNNEPVKIKEEPVDDFTEKDDEDTLSAPDEAVVDEAASLQKIINSLDSFENHQYVDIPELVQIQNFTSSDLQMLQKALLSGTQKLSDLIGAGSKAVSVMKINQPSSENANQIPSLAAKVLTNNLLQNVQKAAQPGVPGPQTGMTGTISGTAGLKLGVTGPKPGVTGLLLGVTEPKPGMTGIQPSKTGIQHGITASQSGMTSLQTNKSLQPVNRTLLYLKSQDSKNPSPKTRRVNAGSVRKKRFRIEQVDETSVKRIRVEPKVKPIQDWDPNDSTLWNYSSEGDFIFDHDYLQTPYARSGVFTKSLDTRFSFENVDGNRVLWCFVCGVKHHERVHLLHMSRHPSTCPVCNKTFKNTLMLNPHIKTHTVKCEVCSGMFSYSELLAHSRMHPEKINPSGQKKLNPKSHQTASIKLKNCRRYARLRTGNDVASTSRNTDDVTENKTNQPTKERVTEQTNKHNPYVLLVDVLRTQPETTHTTPTKAEPPAKPCDTKIKKMDSVESSEPSDHTDSDPDYSGYVQRRRSTRKRRSPKIKRESIVLRRRTVRNGTKVNKPQK